MADPMSTGWYYLKSGAPVNQQVGPLTWEQLHGLRASGSLQPADMVWHPSMPQWLPATQVPGLFPAAAPIAYQPGVQPGGGYAGGFQPSPYQQAPYQPSPYQQAPYMQAGQPAWAGQAGYGPAVRKRSSIAAWLVPLIALVVVGAGLGAYFGFWYHKGGGVSASDLVGHWEGTVVYKTIDLVNPTADDQAQREAVLNKEIPATLDLTLDEGVSSLAQMTRAMAGDQKQATGTAALTMDLTAIDPSYGTVTNNMTFTYSGNKLTFKSTDLVAGTESVTAQVSRKGDLLNMEGTTTFDDGSSTGKAVWNMSMESPATASTEGNGAGGGTETTVTGTGEGGAFVPTDLNGTWNGTLTITSSSGDPWAAKGLTAALLGTISGLPIPVTMEITADESGTGTGKLLVSATSLGAAFDIGTENMPLTSDGTSLTFQPASWPWGVPTMTAEVTQAGGGLTMDGTFSYSDAASSFEATYHVTK